MDRVELIRGKRFEEVSRPLMVAESFPFRVVFGRLHLVDARIVHQVRRHQHTHYEVMLIESGRYVATINDHPIELGPGGVAILKPLDHHEDRCEGPVAFTAVTFQVLPGPDTGVSASLFVDAIAPTVQAFVSDGSLHAIAMRMHAEGLRGDPFTGALLDALTLEFACQLARSVPRELVNPRLLADHPQNTFARDLLRVFEQRLGENLGLSAMAELMAMSERSLSARCREAFGDSPTRLFVRFKMDRARTLLMQTDRPIKEISRYLGFENPYHFSTVYKRVHGQPPTQHRG